MSCIPQPDLFSDGSSENISILIFTSVQGLKPTGTLHKQKQTGKGTLEGSQEAGSEWYGLDQPSEKPLASFPIAPAASCW